MTKTPCPAAEIDTERLRRFIVGIVGHQDADDVMQDTFVRLLTSPAGFAGKSSYETWVFATAKNTAIDHLRKQQVHGGFNDRHCRFVPLDKASGFEAPALSDTELSAPMTSALASLLDDERRVLTSVTEDSASHAELAAELGMSPIRFRDLLFRARKKMRKALAS